MKVSRRNVLRGFGAMAMGAAGIGTTARRAYAADLPGFQMSWVPNVEFAGEILAKVNGFYLAEGTDIDLRAGGPDVAVVPLTVSREVLIGVEAVDGISAAVANKAPVRIVGATYQSDPTVIMSLAKAPIQQPKDIVGKKIGIQSGSELRMKSFCEVNNIDTAAVNFVPVGFDPTPLVVGEVDGFLSFLTNQPIDLALKGIETETLLLADFGLAQFADCLIVHQAVLDDAALRQSAVNMIRATIRGWQIAVENYDAAADAVMQAYGNDFQFDRETQVRSAKAQAALIANAEAQKNGLLTMSEDAIAANIATLDRIGITANRDLFVTDLLTEAFDGKTKL